MIASILRSKSLLGTLILLIGGLILSIIFQHWDTVFIAVATIILSLTPIFLQKRYSLHIPPSFLGATAFFLFATLFLGETQGYYERFWWWDLITHFSSAIGFSLVAIVVLLLILGKRRGEEHPIVFAVFTLSFSIAIGALWEIVEFTLDQTLGWNMQKSGLLDTMSDLIVDLLGGVVASASAYLYLVGFSYAPFARLIEEGFIVNKTLARKARSAAPKDLISQTQNPEPKNNEQ